MVQYQLVVLGGLRLRPHQNMLGYLGEVLLYVLQEDGVVFVGLDVGELGVQVGDVDAVRGVLDQHAVVWRWVPRTLTPVLGVGQRRRGLCWCCVRMGGWGQSGRGARAGDR